MGSILFIFARDFYSLVDNHMFEKYIYHEIPKITFEMFYVSKRKRGKFTLNDTSTDM